jgi:hypothetical protein
MKALRIIPTSIFLLVILGCATATGRKPFSPPPEAYERWGKPGANPTEIQMALLECGLPAPFSVNKFFKDIPHEELLELHARVELCMEKSGFSLLPGLSSSCQNIPALRSCQAASVPLIPLRNPARRLNSEFCKDSIYGKNKACQS